MLMPLTKHTTAVPSRQMFAVRQRHDETLKNTRQQKKKRTHALLSSESGKHHYHV